MKYYPFILFLLLSACSGLPSAIQNAPASDLVYDQASSHIAQFINTPIRWGGVIIKVENEEQDSLMQIVYYPLDFSGRPQLYKSGQGRFVVRSREFLDPAVYLKDKEVTVAGVITGAVELTVGKRIIEVPEVLANAVHLWPSLQEPYHYPGFYPYPYYGYPAYYPYYWGGFYSPFYRW